MYMYISTCQCHEEHVKQMKRQLTCTKKYLIIYMNHCISFFFLIFCSIWLESISCLPLPTNRTMFSCENDQETPNCIYTDIFCFFIFHNSFSLNPDYHTLDPFTISPIVLSTVILFFFIIIRYFSRCLNLHNHHCHLAISFCTIALYVLNN